MDRADARRDPIWSVVVVPGDARGHVREYHLTVAQIAASRYGVVALAGVVLALLIGLGVTLPRTLAYPSLVEENLGLKLHLQSIDRKMSEVDRILLRLRLYDAQVKSLRPGEVPAKAAAPPSRPEEGDVVGDDDDGGTDAWEDDEPEEPRSAETWATSIEARMDDFLRTFSVAEPDLARLLEKLEDLHALEGALPTRWPAHGWLTSPFGWRHDPFTGRWKYHDGFDIASGKGTPIYATADGVVVRAGWSSGYGRMVEIAHGFGVSTLYGHCSRLYVSVGDRVQKGQRVGAMGSTGRSTGPHVHFEVRIDGRAVDPGDWLP